MDLAPICCQKGYSLTLFSDDDVFFQQAGKHFVQRPSIIKGPVQTQKPYSIPAPVHEYSIPTANRFSVLGN